MENVEISKLTCEYLENPLGIDELIPRLSWNLNSKVRGQFQTAYRIIVASSEKFLAEDEGDCWDTEKVESNQCIHIVYNGIPLESEKYYFWKVMVWDKEGNPSDWSNFSYWSMGLLNENDWKAKWIGLKKFPEEKIKQFKDNTDEKIYLPSPLIRKRFVIEENAKIRRVIIHATALGVYELFLNGRRVGRQIFAPEWTDYNKRLQYQTYDVSDSIVKGENVIGATLGDGWYAGNLMWAQNMNHGYYGIDKRLFFQMRIEYQNGFYRLINSDGTWKIYEDGPIQSSDFYMGEVYDARKEKKGWFQPGFEDPEWEQAIVDDSINKKLISQMNEPIRIFKKLAPIEVTEPTPGVFIFNMGQNMVGWCGIRLRGPKETKVTLRHGEMLDLDGNLYVKNLRAAKSIDIFILGENSEDKEREYHPHFTYHGFQYVEVTGLIRDNNELPSLDILTGYAFSSDPEKSGSFECSKNEINKLFSNIYWTQRDNLISVPTDCPQRDERMGWMGDAQAFFQTSVYNMNLAAFYSKWVKDIRDDQLRNGKFPNFVPNIYQGPFPVTEPTDDFDPDQVIGAPAWSDAGMIIPWGVYLNYSDTRIIEKHYIAGKKYIDFLISSNPNYLWINEKSYVFGDWLNAETIISDELPKQRAKIPVNVLSTIYFYNSTRILAKMAKILDNEEEQNLYNEHAKKIKKAFNEEFVNEDGVIKRDTQAGYALALYYDLIHQESQPKVLENLVKSIEKFDWLMSTGFCGTLPLMQVLTERGYENIAYDLLFSHRFPSWLYMIDQGATTMWERWDGFVKGRGFQDESMNSFNHYSIGSVGEWFYRSLLGINLDPDIPGYKHVIVHPKFGKGENSINWVKGYYDSIYGKIQVEWFKEDNSFVMDVVIPVNTTATVYLPIDQKNDIDVIKESGSPISDSEEITFLKFEKNKAILKIQSGVYHFEI